MKSLSRKPSYLHEPTFPCSYFELQICLTILDRIYFREGIHVDPEGHATPFFENASGKEDRVNVLYVSNGARVSVKASEIELRFYGMDAFKVVAGE